MKATLVSYYACLLVTNSNAALSSGEIVLTVVIYLSNKKVCTDNR